ncbi:hypothetical protein TNIN_43841 [Trichonephila inaurata madagascariensis]|uniref:Uncharacterized protein n=1 Tax=Trichonephila inaurata madagascariensis TaxID=2747483 RepID=A0A8X6WPQ4_9ARAC|nr:hypothetical protein TNIN_43841 [Trichonephila inaurata madagascariensis]
MKKRTKNCSKPAHCRYNPKPLRVSKSGLKKKATFHVKDNPQWNPKRSNSPYKAANGNEATARMIHRKRFLKKQLKNSQTFERIHQELVNRLMLSKMKWAMEDNPELLKWAIVDNTELLKRKK